MAPVLGRRDAGAGEYDVRKRPAVDRSLVDCYHLRIWDLKIRELVDPLIMILLMQLLFPDVLLNFYICFNYISQ